MIVFFVSREVDISASLFSIPLYTFICLFLWDNLVVLAFRVADSEGPGCLIDCLVTLEQPTYLLVDLLLFRLPPDGWSSVLLRACRTISRTLSTSEVASCACPLFVHGG